MHVIEQLIDNGHGYTHWWRCYFLLLI